MSEPQAVNPLLSKLKMPGRIFQLPSRGLLYSDGELSPTIKDAELHVRPMSAFDEIIMKNPDLLFSGKALDQVFATCVPGIEKPVQLLGKDVDALMLFLRLVTYGPQYDIVANHYCENSMQHRYSVDLEKLMASMKYIDPTTIEEQYRLTMANGQVVQIQPVRYAHVIEMLQANEGKKKLSVEDVQNNLMINLRNVIKSVDGIEDKELITGWIKEAPASYINTIADSVEKTHDWGLDLSVTLKCKDCGEDYSIQIPINPISFFV